VVGVGMLCRLVLVWLCLAWLAIFLKNSGVERMKKKQKDLLVDLFLSFGNVKERT